MLVIVCQWVSLPTFLTDISLQIQGSKTERKKKNHYFHKFLYVHETVTQAFAQSWNPLPGTGLPVCLDVVSSKYFLEIS